MSRLQNNVFSIDDYFDEQSGCSEPIYEPIMDSSVATLRPTSLDFESEPRSYESATTSNQTSWTLDTEYVGLHSFHSLGKIFV